MRISTQEEKGGRTAVVLRAALAAAGVAAAIGLGWVAARVGSGRAGSPPASAPESALPPAAEDLAAESQELEMMFDDAMIADAVPTGEQTGWLEEAVLAQRGLVRILGREEGDEVERLRAMEGKLARARVLALEAQSTRLERLAEDQLASGDREGAVASLREALERQREIRALPGGGEIPGGDRASEILARIEAITVEPLAAEVDRLEREAEEAAAAGRIDDAHGLYLEAAALQVRLNREFAHTRHASRLRLQRLEDELASLGAAALAAQRDDLVAEGARRRDAGLPRDAARLFERAAELQRQINAVYPASRFASEALLRQFEAARARAAGGGTGSGGAPPPGDPPGQRDAAPP